MLATLVAGFALVSILVVWSDGRLPVLALLALFAAVHVRAARVDQARHP